MTEAFMTDPTQPLIEHLLQAAYYHGAEAGSETEAGDLQEMIRDAWELLTTEQRAAFFRRPEITTLKKIPEVEHFRHDRDRRTALIQ
jgi:hypothetical protein